MFRVFLSFLVTASVACAPSAEAEHGFVVAAPESYLGAAVTLDGKPIGELQHLEPHGSIVEAVIKKFYRDSPALHVVALKIDLANTPLTKGQHELRVEKHGVPPAHGSFTYPFAGEQFQTFFVNGTRIEPAPGVNGREHR